MPTRSSIMDILSSPHTLSSAPFDIWFDPAGYTMKRSRYAKAVYVLQVLDAMVRSKNKFIFFFLSIVVSSFFGLLRLLTLFSFLFTIYRLPFWCINKL